MAGNRDGSHAVGSRCDNDDTECRLFISSDWMNRAVATMNVRECGKCAAKKLVDGV